MSLEVDLFRRNEFESHYKFMREKKGWHMLCRKWFEISLSALLNNCHDVTGRISHRWITRQKDMKSPLKWHNQLEKKILKMKDF